MTCKSTCTRRCTALEDADSLSNSIPNRNRISIGSDLMCSLIAYSRSLNHHQLYASQSSRFYQLPESKPRISISTCRSSQHTFVTITYTIRHPVILSHIRTVATTILPNHIGEKHSVLSALPRGIPSSHFSTLSSSPLDMSTSLLMIINQHQIS